MNSNYSIELCTNDEWLASSIVDDYGLDHSAWLNEVAIIYYVTAVDRVRDSDLFDGCKVQAARGERRLYHGWNGAHFDVRCGIFGVWGQLSDEQLAALEAADAAGYAAAVALAANCKAQQVAD